MLAEVYPAGEAPIVAADGRALARAVRVAGKVEPVFVEDIADLPATLRALARDGDVVLTMGAGSIGGTPQQLVTPMMMHEPLHFTGLRGTLARDEPLAKYTSWRAGGAADTLYVPADRDDLALFLRQLPADEPLLCSASAATRWCATAACAARSSSCTTPARRSPSPTASSTPTPALACPKLARFAADARLRRSGVPGRHSRAPSAARWR